MVAILQGPFGLIVLNMPTLTIGYASDNQLVISDPSASPYHAIIRVETQRVSIMDAGSGNGTYVNEQRLEPNSPRFLSANDTIRIGNTTFRYEERVDSPEATLFADNREAGPTLPSDAQARPGGYTNYGQQQGGQPPPLPVYAPPPPPYNPNPYDPAQTPTQLAGGSTPFPPSSSLPVQGLQGQPYTMPPSEPKKSNLLKILLIAAAALIILVAAGGGIFAYVVTRPQPVISVNSDYSVNMTPAGSTTTEFRVNGHNFSTNSSITFLLDGEPAPGSLVAQSDNNGKVTTTLTVTKDWSVGSHMLTAKDASGYTTKDGVAIKIVPQGQAHTPGPNGAPTDDTSFTINVTYSGVSGQTDLQVSGHPDPTGGTVCVSGANSTQTSTGQDDIGTYTDTYTITCAGTYKGGKLSFTETLNNETYTYTNGVVCTESAPFVALRLEGTFSSATSISGNYSSDSSNYNCTQGATLSYNASQGTWNGQVK